MRVRSWNLPRSSVITKFLFQYFGWAGLSCPARSMEVFTLCHFVRKAFGRNAGVHRCTSAPCDFYSCSVYLLERDCYGTPRLSECYCISLSRLTACSPFSVFRVSVGALVCSSIRLSARYCKQIDVPLFVSASVVVYLSLSRLCACFLRAAVLVAFTLFVFALQLNKVQRTMSDILAAQTSNPRAIEIDIMRIDNAVSMIDAVRRRRANYSIFFFFFFYC